MIRATLDASRLKGQPQRYLALVKRKVQLLLLKLQAKIVNEKLQGQVLRHVSGKLGRSIVAEPVEVTGDTVTGTVEGASPPAYYGHYHEDGGSRFYPVVAKNKKALAFIAHGGAKTFAKQVMHPPLKQRSFMRSSLDEMMREVIEELGNVEEF
jgi:hypothetical protein